VTPEGNFCVSKIYHSREDRIGEIHDGAERISYDGRDKERIDQVRDVSDEYFTELYDACDDYVRSSDDEELEYNRRALIERWALAQAALSKVAWVMRFDGNKAYERMMDALKNGATADMRGL
jgi:hypothetical protein